MFYWMYLLVVCSVTSADFIDPMFDLSNTNQALNTCSSNLPIVEVQISSQCRQRCVEDATCVAFYTYPYSYRWKCFLFSYGTPHRWSNTTRPNDISGVKIYPGSTWFADGFYYVVLNTPSLNFTYAREDCKKLLGYRLALIKTKQSYDYVLSKYQSGGQNWIFVVVDLQQNIGNKKATFGDGTPYENSEVANAGTILTYDATPLYDRAVFILWYGFNDERANQQFYALCQGDPLMMMITY